MSWDVITAAGGTLLITMTVGAFLIRYALVPYLKAQMTDPITVQLSSIIQLANEAVMQVGVMVKAWDGHQEWSQREVDRVWNQLLVHERMIARQRIGDEK